MTDRDALIAELRWCLEEGSQGPRSAKALAAALDALSTPPPVLDRANARRMHVAFNVMRARSGQRLPACDGPDCLLCDFLQAQWKPAPTPDVRAWAIANGERDDMRIALCGYDGEHEMPASWSVYEWNAGEGFGGQADKRSGNGRRERIWFSPACVDDQPSLFGAEQLEMGA